MAFATSKHPAEAAWPKHDFGLNPVDDDDFAIGSTVSVCETHIRKGFLRKVFGLVAMQLLVTSAIACLFMFEPNTRSFVLAHPGLLLPTFFLSLGSLIACQVNKDSHPKNLYCLAGFTVSMAWSIGVVCAKYYAAGLGVIVLEALLLTASVTAGLTLYTLSSKHDFSYLGAGLGASLWVLIFGGFIASLVGSSLVHFGLAVAGAVVFSLYIIYDVHAIARKLSPDEYIPAAIQLYLDILNLFLNILRILSELQGKD